MGVPGGRGQYSRLNFHVNPHLRLVYIMWSARVFVLSLPSDVTEIKCVKVTHESQLLLPLQNYSLQANKSPTSI